MTAQAPRDVLVVGAGPTGLALAAQLARYGVRLRIVDAHLDRVHESRALAVQPRTLEVLAPLGGSGPGTRVPHRPGGPASPDRPLPAGNVW